MVHKRDIAEELAGLIVLQCPDTKEFCPELGYCLLIANALEPVKIVQYKMNTSCHLVNVFIYPAGRVRL